MLRWPEYFIDFFIWKMDPMSDFHIRLVFTLPPRNGTLQNKRRVHLWNNFPCLITLVSPNCIPFKNEVLPYTTESFSELNLSKEQSEENIVFMQYFHAGFNGRMHNRRPSLLNKWYLAKLPRMSINKKIIKKNWVMLQIKFICLISTCANLKLPK